RARYRLVELDLPDRRRTPSEFRLVVIIERQHPVSGRVEDVSTQDPEREAKDEVKIVTSDPLDILGVEILAELALSRHATVDLLHPRKDGRHVARAVTRKPPVRKQPRED